MEAPALELTGVSKHFGTTRAVDGVSAVFQPRTITALLGENGAGKTTLMRIVAGFLRPDAGAVKLGGRELHARGPADARRERVEMVHQHFVLASALTVAENIALADPALPRIASPRALIERAEDAIGRSGVSLDRLERRVSELSVGEKAKIDLVKALNRDPAVLILDEPTSVLSPPEVADLGRVLRQRADAGAVVILITHRLPEVFSMADEIALMRNGKMILRERVVSTSREAVARAMSNVEPLPRRTSSSVPGEAVLELRDVSTRSAAEQLSLRQVSLVVRRSELVAIVGAAGNGQDQLAEVLRGLQPHDGEILIEGRAVTSGQLSADRSIAQVPADRTAAGVIGGLSIAEHLSLKNGSTGKQALAIAADAVAAFGIRASSPRQDVATLSGGNQQKVIAARELAVAPHLLVASEPTRGLDVESALSIRNRIAGFAASAGAVLLITSDLDEALSLADSVRVIYRGRLSDPLPPGDIDAISRHLAGVE